MWFWLLKDVPIVNTTIDSLISMSIYEPAKGDVFVWVYEKAPTRQRPKDDDIDANAEEEADENAIMMKLPEGSNIKFDVIQRDGSNRSVTTNVVTIQIQRYRNSRRTGWLILKNITY